jgi:murein DD-endopeptidase MepM/ murein hydrolase activator NlpD
MRRLSGIGALGLLLLPQQLLVTDPPAPLSFPASQVLAAAPVSLTVLRGNVSRNGTLEKAIGHVLTPRGVDDLVRTARPLYDLARLTVGNAFDVTVGAEGLLEFSYVIDELRTLQVQRNGDGFEAQVYTKRYETRTESATGLITSSLFGAVAEAGEEPQLALDLAQVFEWDVDFNTELQRGDSFRVVVEKLYLDGSFARYGPILSAELVRGPRVIRAVRFEGTGRPEYYTPEGVPLRKTFLRSPLRFSRISSRFSRARFHPILKRFRPHLGVDYAAPAGTPVRAAAAGVVSQAGWQGGYGKIVKLRHARGLQTLYGHLSRIHVKPRQRVEQGELIGNVGSTGLSTAPHLDYRTLRDNVFVNPLTIQPPPPEPLSAALRPAFEDVRARSIALLEAVGAPAAGPTRVASE